MTTDIASVNPSGLKNALARSRSRTTIVRWSKCFSIVLLRACQERCQRRVALLAQLVDLGAAPAVGRFEYLEVLVEIHEVGAFDGRHREHQVERADRQRLEALVHAEAALQHAHRIGYRRQLAAAGWREHRTQQPPAPRNMAVVDLETLAQVAD